MERGWLWLALWATPAVTTNIKKWEMRVVAIANLQTNRERTRQGKGVFVLKFHITIQQWASLPLPVTFYCGFYLRNYIINKLRAKWTAINLVFLLYLICMYIVQFCLLLYIRYVIHGSVVALKVKRWESWLSSSSMKFKYKATCYASGVTFRLPANYATTYY